MNILPEEMMFVRAMRNSPFSIKVARWLSSGRKGGHEVLKGNALLIIGSAFILIGSTVVTMSARNRSPAKSIRLSPS
jgi:hypothetical protein